MQTGTTSICTLLVASFAFQAEAEQIARTKDCLNCAEMVEIKTPEFDFLIGAFEVTVGNWRQCVKEQFCRDTNLSQDQANHTVHNIEIQDISNFLDWLNSKSFGYRLPNETEWMVAASWKKPHLFDRAKDLRSRGNFGREGTGGVFTEAEDRWTKLAPVGQFLPNAHGLSDTIGNVAEVVDDCHDFVGEKDSGKPPLHLRSSCETYVVKGGSYLNASFVTEPSFQFFLPFDSTSPQIGFRVLKVN